MPEHKHKHNCPNCGAPRTGTRCEYCGTPFLYYAYAGEIPDVTVDIELTSLDVETITTYVNRPRRLLGCENGN